MDTSGQELSLTVRCPQCRALPGVMCGNRSEVHPVRRGAARSGPPAERADRLGPAPQRTGPAPWDDYFEHGDDDWLDRPSPPELHAAVLGADEHEIMCCAKLRTEEGCPVCDRDCWLCHARAGRACRSLPAARRLARVAHVARLWNLSRDGENTYRDATTRPCPHCQAQPGWLCRTVPHTDARIHLVKRPHQRRR